MKQTRQSIACAVVLTSLLALASGCAPRVAVPAPALPARVDRVAALATTPAIETASVRVELAPEVAAVEAQPAPSCPEAGERVLLIGDSLSAGLGPVMAEHARACGTVFFHHGVVGSHVTEWAHDSWLTPDLERARPTTVVVSLGGNDFRRFDKERVQQGIATLISKVQQSGARLLWISPPTMPFEDRVGAREMWREALGGELGVDWFATEELSIPRQEDRIHPTVAGYEALALTLWTWVSSVRRKTA